MARARSVLAVWVLAALCGCEPEERVEFVAFSPDGRAVAYTASRTLYLHGLPAGALLGEVAKGEVAEPRFDWTPDGSSLAFTTRQFGGYDLALVSVKDLSIQRLTTHLAKDAEPCVVMDGEAVAFVSYRDGQPDLYLMTLADRSIKRLTSDPVLESSLSTDRTGTTLAFLSTNETGERWLSLVRLPEVERRLNVHLDQSLTAGPDPIGAVRLSPDGEWIGFTSPVGVCLVDVERARRRLRDDPNRKLLTDVLIGDTTRASDFAFAPDGRRLAYSAEGQVRLRGLAFLVFGGRVSHAKATDDRSPAWGPAGELIALAAQGAQIEIRDRGGRHVRWLVRDAEHTLGAADIALRRGDADQAIALLAPLAAAPEATDETKQLLALAYLRAGRKDEVLPLCKGLEDRTTVGLILLALEHFDEALEAFKASGDAEAAAYLETLPKLDAGARRALAEAVLAQLRDDPDEAAEKMRRFCRRETARGTPLGARYAYLRIEMLEERAGQASGRQRAWAFKAVVRAVRDALEDWPEVKTQTKEAAVRRMKNAYLKELDDPRAAFEGLKVLLDLFESRARTEPGGALAAGEAEADAAVELVRVCLDLKWPMEARKVVRRVARWSFKDDATAVSLCRRVASAYDSHDARAAGTAALETLVGAYRLQAPQLTALVGEWLPVAVAEAKVKGLDLAALPPWAKDRARRVVQATPPGPNRDNAIETLNLLLAGTHAERKALWDRLAKGWRGRVDDADYRAARTIADTVLGTDCLQAGQIEAALDYFEDLARLRGRGAYGRALKQYRDLFGKHPELVTLWLDAERRSLVLYLEPPLAAEFTARMIAPLGTDPATKDADVRQRWTAIFNPFLAQAAASGDTIPNGVPVPRELQDNFLYRASHVVDEVTAETYLHTLVVKYPESEFATEAFNGLADRWEARGTYLLACTLGQRLLDALAADEAATVKFRVAGLYAEQLKRDDLARPFYQDVADHHAGAPQWAEAQYWMAGDEAGHERHDQAAQRLQTLIKDAPQARMVADGTAQHELATALRLAGKHKEADEAYLHLIKTYRQHPAVKDARALAGLWALLGDEAKRTVAEQFPDDLKRLFPHLALEEQKKVERDFPALVSAPATQPTTRPAP